METIGSHKIWSFSRDLTEIKEASNTAVRKSPGVFVRNYVELAKAVSSLQYNNRDYVLMFRGQSTDHGNRQKNTTLKPTIFRAPRTTADDYARRFELLRRAEDMLVERYALASFSGITRLRRQRILRWSILQHYEVCPTPLLDVTHSVRIAASFASASGGARAFFYVLGIPNLSGAVTASAEAGIQVVRLSGVCPPEAVRPHIQEGYLLGEYPDMDRAEQKSLYQGYEVDFGLRLIAKFQFEPASFWRQSPNFPQVPHVALYPSSADDPMRRIGDAIKSVL